jgi:hypothetical protein
MNGRDYVRVLWVASDGEQGRKEMAMQAFFS